MKAGCIHGASDATGNEPVEKPVKWADLAATIHHLLGIDPVAHVTDAQNRPLMISSGEPIWDVMA